MIFPYVVVKIQTQMNLENLYITPRLIINPVSINFDEDSDSKTELATQFK